MEDRPIPTAAALSGVREVSLLGSADHAPWRALLASERLDLLEHEGRAQIMIIGAEGRFRGIGFRELSFSVLVRPGGAFLVQAFNSRRFFAWVERTIFHTPYAHGAVGIEAAGLRLDPLFRAAGQGPTGPAAPDGWSGPVFLPGGTRCFRARLEGGTHRRPFRPESDLLELARSDRFPVFGLLLDSGFRPTEWALRPDATHVKSKTVGRDVGGAVQA